MRHAIQTAPRDGHFVILEDGANAVYDVGRWSPKAGAWLGKDDGPLKITPTHWHSASGDAYLQPHEEGPVAGAAIRKWAPGRFFTPVLSAIAAAAILFYYVAQEAAQPPTINSIVAPSAGLSSGDTKAALSEAGPTVGGKASTPAEETHAVPEQSAAAMPVSDVPQAPGLKPSDASAQEAALAQELGEARRTIERLQAQLQAGQTAEQELKQERERVAVLVQDAATAREELLASTAQHGQALDEERARGAALVSELTAARRDIETQAAQSRQASDEREQSRRAEIAKAEKLLEQQRESIAAALADAASARQELNAGIAQHQQALDEERARSAALASELGAARQEIATQAAQSSQANTETALPKATETASAEPSPEQQRETLATAMADAAAARQELKVILGQIDEERARNGTMASELAAAQQVNEKLAVQFRLIGEQTDLRRRAYEAELAALHQALKQERENGAADAAEVDAARRAAAARSQPEAAATDTLPPEVASAIRATLPTPTASDPRSGEEAARMIARASLLLGQGDIGAARIVLERAAQSGNARAVFMLAETYDPGVLATWKTYGTRGEVTRARELYARAQAGGIREAKDRLDGLTR